MDSVTIRFLNQINQEFYRQTADSFDQSRGQPWPGWERLLPYLAPPLSVLDVGCGNGRFGLFLASRLGDGVSYSGIDSNPDLLDRARAALTGMDAHLEQRDILDQPPNQGEYDLVVLFGVLHHIPGATQRRDLMRLLAQRLKPGGLFAFAAWRFYEYPRFRERIAPWPDNLEAEANDYLLDWRRGVHALRYCHYVDDTEHADLAATTGLAEILTYRADGHTHDTNRYSLLRRESHA